MPKNTNILLVRHAEKPEKHHDPAISVDGQKRAHAYVIYFQNYTIHFQTMNLDYLFAAEDSAESHRSRLTITPLSRALDLKINDKHKDHHYQKVADHILQNPKYEGSSILICWHHGKILQLAAALGVDPAELPPQANWPSEWPDNVFGWLLQLSYDPAGNLIPSQTWCTSQQLMVSDYAQNPAAAKNNQ